VLGGTYCTYFLAGICKKKALNKQFILSVAALQRQLNENSLNIQWRRNSSNQPTNQPPTILRESPKLASFTPRTCHRETKRIWHEHTAWRNASHSEVTAIVRARNKRPAMSTRRPPRRTSTPEGNCGSSSPLSKTSAKQGMVSLELPETRR
jgi:hypothetical protein